MSNAGPSSTVTQIPTSSFEIQQDTNGNTCSLLEKCFSAIVKGQQLNLDMEILSIILQKELNLKTDSFTPDELTVARLMLVWYIKAWPGWQKSPEFHTGKLSFALWFDKFHIYINLKMNHLINTGLKDTIKEINEEKLREMEGLCQSKKIVHRGQQTDNLAPKSFAPFAIEIASEPSLLNKLVFTEVNYDSVLLKCHSEIRWENLSVQQLLSWPHVEVHFTSPLFEFSRRNVHEYKRQINLANTPLVPQPPEFIEDISLIDQSKPRVVYGLNFLMQIAKDLLEILESKTNKNSAHYVDLDLLEVVLRAFLQDISDIGFDSTIATNTSVTFNIGKSTYSRNKKLSKGSTSKVVVSLNEMIVPKIKLDFVAFNGVGFVTDDTDKILCQYLKSLGCKQSLSADDIPKVSFRCNYCELSFITSELIIQHLMNIHKMSQPVLCVSCKNSFSVPFLTDNRWSHPCKSSKYK